EDDRDDRLRASRDLRPAVVQANEEGGRQDREKPREGPFVEAEQDEIGGPHHGLQRDDGAEAEAEDVERRDDAVAEPRHPTAEEAPGVTHRPTDPEIPASRLRKG